MSDYYRDKLAAERLKKVYDLATPRVRQYLEAEIDFVVNQIRPGDRVLELGCGYGRVLERLATKAQYVVGIDSSLSSLQLARELFGANPDLSLACMDAAKLGFMDRAFDIVVCIQNGISAFHVDQRVLILETIRVTRPGGKILFSTYSEKFWHDRLEWFRLQSEAGLLGEIDYGRTRDGDIVCKDGFTATTVTRDGFGMLLDGLAVGSRIVEVDSSSLFCEINV
jgi:SAM-dependent methyltransferase